MSNRLDPVIAAPVPLDKRIDKWFRRVEHATSVALCVMLPTLLLYAADQTWDGGVDTGTSFTGTAWLTNTYWATDPVPANIPGSKTVTTNTDTATFGAAGTAATIGLNMNTTVGVYYLGAINMTTGSRNIGNSSTSKSGVLTLNGATVNSVANVILRNAGAGALTIQANQVTQQSMGLALGNATANVVSIDSTGGIVVSSVISSTATAGPLTLAAAGSGTLTLTGNNTYTGGTTVASGMLVVNNTGGAGTSGTGTGAVTVGNNTGVATLAGTGTISGLVTMASTGSNVAHLAPAGVGAAGTLTLAGGLTIGNGSALDFDLGATSDLVAVTGGILTLGSAITLNVTQGVGFSSAGTYTLFNFTGGTLANSGNFSGWTFTGVPAATGATFTVSGTTITVTFASTVTPNYFDTNGATAGVGYTSGPAPWDTTTTNWNSVSTGDSAPKTYDGTQPAIFAGTSTAVTVAAGGVTAASGLQFLSDGYIIAGGKITLGGTSSAIIVQNSTDTATINSIISGTNGLTKSGAGTLILGGANDFTGPISITAGTLSISSATNLGPAATNPLSLGGATLQVTADVTLLTARTVDGAGTLDVADGKTLTINGTYGATTPGAITLVNTGTVVLANATTAFTGLTFNAAGTLKVTGAVVTLPATVTNTAPSGSATLTAPLGIDAGTTAHTLTIGPGSTLVLDGALKGSGNLSKSSGAGTLVLKGVNTAYTGTITIGGTTTSGGTISILNQNALGANTMNFDTGTLSNDSGTPLTGASAIPVILSIGAQGTTSGGAVLSGSDMEFTGAVSIFKSTGTASQRIVVNNTTTFSGVWGTSQGTGTSSGINIVGPGKLVLAGSAPNTFTEAVNIDGSSAGTILAITKTGGLGANVVTVKAGGTLLVGDIVASSVQGSTSGPVTVQSGGTLSGLGSVGDIDVQSGSTLSPGTSNQSIGTLTGTNLTWEAGATLAFALGPSTNTSDKLSLGTGVLTKSGTGAFVFDFQNTGTAATSYQLLTFASAATFAPTDFSYVNLAPGLSGNFVLSGTDLTFAMVPEPGSFAFLASGVAGILGLGRWRRQTARK